MFCESSHQEKTESQRHEGVAPDGGQLDVTSVRETTYKGHFVLEQDVSLLLSLPLRKKA